MPLMIPVEKLQDTESISMLCKTCDAPIFLMNGESCDMVLMSMEAYERDLYLLDVQRKLQESEQSVREGKVKDAYEALQSLKKKYIDQ